MVRLIILEIRSKRSIIYMDREAFVPVYFTWRILLLLVRGGRHIFCAFGMIAGEKRFYENFKNDLCTILLNIENCFLVYEYSLLQVVCEEILQNHMDWLSRFVVMTRFILVKKIIFWKKLRKQYCERYLGMREKIHPHIFN